MMFRESSIKIFIMLLAGTVVLVLNAQIDETSNEIDSTLAYPDTLTYPDSLAADTIFSADSLTIDSTISELPLDSSGTIEFDDTSSVEVLNFGWDSDSLLPVQSDLVYTLPFKPGERLTFDLSFKLALNLFKAGTARLNVEEMKTYKGQPAWHVSSSTNSNSFVDVFYKVRDHFDSLFDFEDLRVLRYDRNIREGNYRRDQFYAYDHESGKVQFSSENGIKDTLEFEPNSMGVLSALYWVRTQDLKVDEELKTTVHDLKDQYEMIVKVLDYETVKVPAGKFKCWKVEPMLKSEGIFLSKGRLIVWISDDENRIPVKLKTEIPVGSIVGKLKSYSLGNEHLEDK